MMMMQYRKKGKLLEKCYYQSQINLEFNHSFVSISTPPRLHNNHHLFGGQLDSSAVAEAVSARKTRQERIRKRLKTKDKSLEIMEL